MKKTFFYLTILVINYLFIEAMSYGLYRFKYGDYSQNKLQKERLETINSIQSGPVFTGELESNAQENRKSREILHPYAGYSNQAISLKPSCNQDAESIECFTRQKMADDLPMPKKAEGVLNVALLGGSVAVGTVNGTPYQTYQKLLSGLPEYKDYKVNLHVMAAGGYKQPQPLMMLNYFYSLGAEYDIVIALDGFNEIAIASSEFKWNKIHPIFPRSWSGRVNDSINPELLKLTAKKFQENESHLAKTTFMSGSFFAKSVTLNLLWKLFDNRYHAKIANLNQKIANLSNVEDTPRSLQYEKLGPDYLFKDWATLAMDSAKIWKNSTYATHGLVASQGAKFFQFIQPNQYIDGAKPEMSANERRIAFTKATDGSYGGYGGWYRIGYPFLKKYQAELQAKGVNSTDLTFLYKDEPGDIYIDNCCHVNSKGSFKIVEAIVKTIHQANLSESRLSK